VLENRMFMPLSGPSRKILFACLVITKTFPVDDVAIYGVTLVDTWRVDSSQSEALIGCYLAHT